MEFTTCLNPISYERFLLLEFLYELSYELHLLVLFTKNIPLLIFIFSHEFYLFLCNSDSDNPSNPIE
jgi:hypothetical protein